MTRSIMRWVVVDTVAITCSTKGEMDNVDWDAFCDDLRKKKVTKTLGLNLGESSLTSLQRKTAAEIAKRQNLKSAVITDSAAVRGVVTALSWFGVSIAGFSWKQFEEAVKYLQMDSALETNVRAAAQKLKQQVEHELVTQRK